MHFHVTYRLSGVKRVDPESDALIEVTLLPEDDEVVQFRTSTSEPMTALRLYLDGETARQFTRHGRYAFDLQAVA